MDWADRQDTLYLFNEQLVTCHAAELPRVLRPFRLDFWENSIEIFQEGHEIVVLHIYFALQIYCSMI